ncbi:MAG: DUF1566 domain-containing protein [Ilumatobacteraceae bacterium]|nr:DUF1566 domain-containing protein [Ilumatobacteraceae bacterium]
MWSGNTGTAVGTTSAGGGGAIGKGYANTSAIIGQADGGNTAGKAATVARGYQGGSKTDWYLPSYDELTQMRTNNPYLGGYTNGTYWSSSQFLGDTAFLQFLYTSGMAHSAKTNSRYVRPIRAFSPTNTCATGGKCVVGDIGPGGGNVFYVASTNFTSTGSVCGTTCKYLEAAPTGWMTASTPFGQTNCTTPGTSTVDPGCEWSGNTTKAIGSTARGTLIGTGYSNTSAMMDQVPGGSTARKAATVARAFRGGSKTDWFLPAHDELNELCKYARNQTTGNTAIGCANVNSVRTGFVSEGFYWSSTEASATDGTYRNFNNGGYATRGKDQNWLYVRPVRAF